METNVGLEMKIGILANFQTVMENIARSRLRDSFSDVRWPGNLEEKGSETRHAFTHNSQVTKISTFEARKSHNMLNMGLIGCLPDNVQKAIRSFSIRPGTQHLTLAFPSMTELIRSREVFSSSDSTNQISDALYFDVGAEVISGFRSLSTLVLNKQRLTLTVVLFTLFETDTIEGIEKHFESLVRILIRPNTPITLWKLPLCVTDLDVPLIASISTACVETILEIQQENMQNSFPGKTRDELFKYLKDQVIYPRFRSYTCHFHQCLKEATRTAVRLPDSGCITTMLEYIQDKNCSAQDFHKVDAFLRHSSTDRTMRSFWSVWGHEQVAPKVFPAANVTRGAQFVQLSNQSKQKTLSPVVANLSIKEGLKNIIDTLKQQSYDKGSVRSTESNDCTCTLCVHSSHQQISASSRMDRPKLESSAFHRPQASRRYSTRLSATPYSDALKAAAVSPFNLDFSRGSHPRDSRCNTQTVGRHPSMRLYRQNHVFKMPHLHGLYCDYFGAKLHTNQTSRQIPADSTTTT